MPTFWHYKVLTIISVDQCTSLFVLAASKVLWLHWVLAQVLDTLKVCNPFVHKLSWPSGSTLAITYHVHVPHAHRHGMNRYRSPRVRWIVDGALFCVGPCQTPNAQRMPISGWSLAYHHCFLEELGLKSIRPAIPRSGPPTPGPLWGNVVGWFFSTSIRLMRCCPKENLYMGLITVYDFVQWSCCQHL